MRKILIFLGLLFVMLSGVYAQKGRQAIGFGLSYGTEIESIGLGLKYQYNITNPIRLEPSLNYFIENDNVSMLDINMNLHYLCPVGRSVKLYPLFGFTFSNWMFDLGDGFDIDIHHPVPVLLAVVYGILPEDNAGIVDQNVHMGK